MKKKYYSYDSYNSASSYEDFIKYLGTYSYDHKTDSIEYNGYVDMNDYQDIINQLLKQYNNSNKEETPEQKAIRLAKEKAEKRNNKIDQILGE